MNAGRGLLRVLTALLFAALVIALPDSSSLAAPRLQAVVEEGFEGDFPGDNFLLMDISEDDGGEYLWGQRDCNPRSGSFAMKSASGGAEGEALGCDAPYPANLDSWAVYGPVDLTDATSASLVFYLYGESEFNEECSLDFFYVAASGDGENFVGDRYCGAWLDGPDNGYTQRTLDLSAYLGNPEVYIAFNFFSNESNEGELEYPGFTIDDLTLTTGTTQVEDSVIYLPMLAR